MTDPFAVFTDDQFIGLFRVDKVLAQDIIDMLRPYIQEGQTYWSIEIKTKVNIIEIYIEHTFI